MNNKSGGLGSHAPETITICVLGISGAERVKGTAGVGKSLLCNRFVRGDYDRFQLEHSSILSQTDFAGSPVINNDHWLYWGEALISGNEPYGSVQVRVIEQTEFVDDETFEPLEGASEEYSRRATRTKLDSADKLMYICKEQLGLEMEFEHRVLPEGRAIINGFIYVYDLSLVEGRSFEKQAEIGAAILLNAIKTKKPVLIAASKADVADENARKALQRLLARKEFKSTTLPVVEVSSFANVNVTGLFTLAAALVEKWKVKAKILSFGEALKIQRQKEHEVSDAYGAVLRELMPIESWPRCRPTWSKLLNRMGLARHAAFTQFVYVFGRADAKKFYQKHVNEAREFWMQRRLQTQTPRLAHVFAALIGAERVRSLSWSEAKEAVCRHPLFDDYFLPLGTLGADLDPLGTDADPASPLAQRNGNDGRLPAELLLIADAESTFLEFKRAVDEDCRRERMEEQFEQALAQCAQVTPGKPLHEVEIFLRGNTAFDSLPSQLAYSIYDKFQELLVKKAEVDFAELLLEKVQLFVDIVLKRRQVTHTMRPLIGLEDGEMSELRSILHEDARYRQLNRLFELRDKMISNYASFVSYPLVQNCFSGSRCVDSIVHDIFSSHLQRCQVVESSQVLDVRLILIGDERRVLDFNFALSKVLHGDIMEYEKGLARIIAMREKEAGVEAMRSNTAVFLVDSYDALDRIKARAFAVSDFGCSPLVVLLADPTHIDLLPALHQQCCSLANNFGGTFIGPASEITFTARRTSSNDLNAVLTREQMSRVLESALLSQTDGRRIDARVQLSLMCGDQFPARCVLNSLLASAVHLTPSPSGGMAIVDFPIASLKRIARIDMRVSAYHSWLVSRAPVPIHGHIFAYSARRRASFAHAVAAARRIVSTSQIPSGDAILFVAVADVTDFFNDEDTNVLLTEGSELADELSASFVTLSPEVAERLHKVTFLEFFERILSTQHHSPVPEILQTHDPNDYASVEDIAPSNFLNCSVGSGNTMLSDSTAGSRNTTSSSHKSLRTYSEASSTPRSTLPLKAACLHTSDGPLSRTTSISNSVSAGIERGEARLGVGESAIPYSTPRRLTVATDTFSFPSGPLHVAPLATPEHIEIANDYMTVKDAVEHGDEESAYATIDFSSRSKGTPLREANTDSCSRSPITEKAKNLIHRLPRMHANSVTAPVPQPKPVLASVSSSASSSSPSNTQPSSGRGMEFHSQRLLVPLPDALLSGMPSSKNCLSPALVNRRLHSISAESLIEVGRLKSPSLYGHAQCAESSSGDSTTKKNSANRFVRKVASSFRFRKGMPRPGNADKRDFEDDERDVSLSLGAVDGGSRSVPHSPLVERSQRVHLKRRDPPSSSEKVSNAFSWLPSRSPRRSARNAVAASEGAQRANGVIGTCDTLLSLASSSADCVPLFVKKCIEYIEQEGGLEVEGLYRVPGNQAQVVDFEKAFVADNHVFLSSLQLPVHAVATSLKNFFAALPDPLIPYNMHDALVACLDGDQSNALTRIKEAVEAWPAANRSTVSYLLRHLARVAHHSDVNSMDFRNLAKVWWPTLFRPNFDSFESMAVFVTRLEMTTQLLIRSAAAQLL